LAFHKQHMIVRSAQWFWLLPYALNLLFSFVPIFSKVFVFSSGKTFAREAVLTFSINFPINDLTLSTELRSGLATKSTAPAFIALCGKLRALYIYMLSRPC